MLANLVAWLNSALSLILGIVWGPPMVVILLGTGFILSVYHRFIQIRAFPTAVKLIFRSEKELSDAPGEVSHLKALCTALSATVGLGNIAGVAIAISIGGPGATVWMMLTGLLGMVTKFNECSLACMHRRLTPKGRVIGAGPMYYIREVPGGKILALLFAFFMMMAAIGAANMFQANQVAVAMQQSFALSPLFVGFILSVIVGCVIIGGAMRVATVASIIVPFMGAIYIIGCLITIFLKAEQIPATLILIMRDAFTGEALTGGAIGTVIMQGVRRALFSSEAGLGTASVAHSLVKTSKPITEGFVALLEPFIDTVVICTITALTISVTGVWQNDTNSQTLVGVALTQAALDSGIPGFGRYFVPFAVFLFAISTIIAWSLYGQEATRYLFGMSKRSVLIYNAVYIVCPIFGAIWGLDPIIAFSDICLAMMVLPNVWAMIWLSGRVKQAAEQYLSDER